MIAASLLRQYSQVPQFKHLSGHSIISVVAWVVFTKSEYVINGYLEPLANFFVDPALADPSYNSEDLVAAWVETGGKNAYLHGPTQALYGLPFGAETSIMAYRKDIFEEHGLDVPVTYDDTPRPTSPRMSTAFSA